jgi:hypothetical protein
MCPPVLRVVLPGNVPRFRSGPDGDGGRQQKGLGFVTRFDDVTVGAGPDLDGPVSALAWRAADLIRQGG